MCISYCKIRVNENIMVQMAIKRSHLGVTD
jgi:hypothetical protein